MQKSRHSDITLFQVLERHEQERPDETAYTFLEGSGSNSRVSFSELATRVRSIAARLQRETFIGERVLLMYQPGLDFIEAILACFAVGVVAVPVQPGKNSRMISRLTSIIGDTGCRIALTNKTTHQIAYLSVSLGPQLYWINTEDIPNIDEPNFVARTTSPEDLAFLQYTSGSTGVPKGVMLNHHNLMSNEAVIERAFAHDESTIFVGWLPFYHDMGLIGNVFQPLFLGVHAVLFSPMTFLLSPVTWLRAISEWRATTSGGPSFAYELCVRRVSEKDMYGVDLSSWRVAYNGAEPVRAKVLADFAQKFRPYGFRSTAFYPCYGMAETTLFLTGGSPDQSLTLLPVDEALLAQDVIVPQDESRVVLVGCGRPHDDHKVKVVSPETLRVLPEERVGEIWASGPSIAMGYWEKAALTKEIFFARTADGTGPWLRTGDLGFLHHGELFVTGRLKDLIIVHGQNHYPDDIESTVCSGNAALRETGIAAFTIESENEAQLVVVAEVQRHAIAGLDHSMRQSIVTKARKEISDLHGLRLHDLVLIKPMTLPKTSSGKIRRSYCRDLYKTNCLDRILVQENTDRPSTVRKMTMAEASR
jgi:acyl-CoA synthetase (AMP-forming)/AMP-acid ligase II